MRVRYSFSSRHTGKLENIRKQKEKYPDLLEKLIDYSDIILEVLDARFPEETRNIEIENKIKEKNKKIIYILNKSDLIDSKKLRKLNYLSPNIAVSCKSYKNIKKLRDLIKRISKTLKKQNISSEKILVGIIGYPNTGKSSLINSLIGRSSAGVGSDAGFTKGIQKLKLTDEINLLDSPGVIPIEKYSNTDSKKIAIQGKLGGKSYSQIKDPGIVVNELMKEFSKEIERFYKINSKGDSETLIEELGKKRKILKKGGEVDEDKTARLIIKDWQNGRINF